MEHVEILLIQSVVMVPTSAVLLLDALMAQISQQVIYDGVAPNGKIAFADVGNGGGGVMVPGPDTMLYGASYSAGARIHTNSWGSYFSGSQYYVGNSIDGYLYRNMVCDEVLLTYSCFTSWC
mmetsp:Transcript_2136/g.2938  ORF Transcript_2136/g.2938 Transcript_2136/m.2938 type:complete len:122 (-) Transcript_2136:317-682(-)